MCYAIALGILQNREDAQECVNDTLTRAWGAIPPARPGVLRTFLGKIAPFILESVYQVLYIRRHNGVDLILAEEGDKVLTVTQKGSQVISGENK